MSTSPPRLSQADYLEHVERLAHAVCDAATDEGWLDLTTGSDEGHTALQRSISELARTLHHVHYDGDGCLDH